MTRPSPPAPLPDAALGEGGLYCEESQAGRRDFAGVRNFYQVGERLG
jgi:hypothetical protein